MKLYKAELLSFGLVALAAFPLVSAYSQPSPAPAAAAASAAPLPSDLAPSAAEIVKLAQSGVGDDVVLAFIKNSQAPYHLSAENILSLKNAGLSSKVLAAMVKHDGLLAEQSGCPGAGGADGCRPDLRPEALCPGTTLPRCPGSGPDGSADAGCPGTTRPGCLSPADAGHARSAAAGG